MEESLSEYMLRRFRSAYPSVPITLSKVKAYLDTVDDVTPFVGVWIET